MSPAVEFARASIWSGISSYGFSALNLFGQIFLAHLLIPADFGIYAFTLAIREIITAMINFSTTQGFIYSKGKQADFNVCLWLNIFSGLLVMIVAIIGGLILNHFYLSIYGWMFAWICLGKVFTAFGNVYLAPLEKDLNYKISALIRGLSATISLSVAIVLANLGAGIWSLAYREIFLGLFLWAGGLIYGPVSYCKLQKRLNIWPQFKFGLRASLVHSIEIFYYRLPDIFVNTLFGKIVLGNFYQARYLSYMQLKLSEPFSEVLFSFLTRYKEDREQMSHYLGWINFILIRATLPISVVLLLFGRQLLIIIFGPQWALAGKYFGYFGVMTLFLPLFNTYVSACFSFDKQSLAAKSYFFGSGVFVIGILFMHYANYTALLYSFGFVVGYIYMINRLWRDHIRFDWLKSIVYPTGIFALIFFIKMIGFPSLWNLLIFVVLYIALFFTERSEWMSVWQLIWGRLGLFSS